MSSHSHLIKMEFWEMKYRLMAFLMLAESKLKSWIIKYGRRDSVELLLQSYLVSTQGSLEFSSQFLVFPIRPFWVCNVALMLFVPDLHRGPQVL